MTTPHVCVLGACRLMLHPLCKHATAGRPFRHICLQQQGSQARRTCCALGVQWCQQSAMVAAVCRACHTPSCPCKPKTPVTGAAQLLRLVALNSHLASVRPLSVVCMLLKGGGGLLRWTTLSHTSTRVQAHTCTCTHTHAGAGCYVTGVADSKEVPIPSLHLVAKKKIALLEGPNTVVSAKAWANLEARTGTVSDVCG